MNNANNKKRKENIEKKNELPTNQKSAMSEEKTLSQRLKRKGYSTDKIGQGFVIHIPQPQRNDKKNNK
jgi:hypothetical protein